MDISEQGLTAKINNNLPLKALPIRELVQIFRTLTLQSLPQYDRGIPF